MKSSLNSSNKNTKKTPILEEEFLKLQKCEEIDTGFYEENRGEKIDGKIKEKNQNFFGKIREILGCGCFKTKK